jgi:hypothetical protein
MQALGLMNGAACGLTRTMSLMNARIERHG